MKRVLLALLCMLTVGITSLTAWSVEKTDVLTSSDLGMTGYSTSHETGPFTSDAKYLAAGIKCTTTSIKNYIQITNQNKGGIASKVSGGKIKSVSVPKLYNTTGNTTSNTLSIYGSNTAPTSYSDMTNGTLIGTISSSNLSVTNTTGTNYNYVTIIASGAICFENISITWEEGFTATASIQGEAGTSISVAKGNSVILNCGFTNGTLDSCQWYYNYDNDYNGEALSGETNISLTIDTSDAEYEPGNTYYFYCYGLSEDADVAYSNIIAITVTDPPYQVSFNAGNGSCGTASLTETSSGAGVTLPPATSGVAGWTFAGWATATCAQTTDAPTLYAAGETYHPTANTTLYAVYSKSEAGSGSTFKLSVDVTKDANTTTYYVGAQNGSNSYMDAPTAEAQAVEFGIETVGTSSYLYYLNGASKKYVSIKTNSTSLSFGNFYKLNICISEK